MVLLVESDGCLSTDTFISLDIPHVLDFIRDFMIVFDVTQIKLCDWMTTNE